MGIIRVLSWRGQGGARVSPPHVTIRSLEDLRRIFEEIFAKGDLS